MNIENIEKNIGYVFVDSSLLKLSLVHRSYLNERDKDEDISEHNERLEFLGDAVLELVVTEFLFKEYDLDEGVMTAVRAALVNYKYIGDVGNNLELDQVILISKGEREELGKARLSIVADCVEAIIGAIYLDGGIAPASDFISKFILSGAHDIIQNKSYKDFKTQLQELSQKHTHNTPYYKVIATEGKDHEKIFTIGVWVGSKRLAIGEGRSKQEAETTAAEKAITVLEEEHQENT